MTSVLHPENMVPASIRHLQGQECLVSITMSPNSMLNTEIPAAVAITQLYQLIHPVELPCQAIKQTIQCGSLTITIVKDIAATLMRFSRAVGTNKQLCSGKSVNMTQTSTYRTSLYAILAMLCLIRTVEDNTTDRASQPPGKVTLISNHEQALRNAFRAGPVGIKDAIHANYDLILEIWYCEHPK